MEKSRFKILHNIKQADVVYVFLIVWIFIFMLSKSMLSVYSDFSFVLGKLMLFIRLALVVITFVNCLMFQQDRKKIIVLTAFTLLVILDYLVADNWMLFELFFVAIFWGDRLEYRKVLKIFAITTLVSIICIALLDVANLLPRYEYVSSRIDRLRTTLGFHHPNALSECIMVVLLCLFLLYNKGYKSIFSKILIVGCVVWVAIFPNTLAVVLVMFFTLLFQLILKMIFKRRQTFSGKIVLFVSIILLTCILCGLLYVIVLSGKYDNNFILRKFETLHSRVLLARKGLDRIPITWFGTSYESTTEIAVYIKQTANEYFTIDCVYFLLPLRYGILATIAFAWFYFQSVYYCIQKENAELLSVLIALLLMMVVDPFITLFIMSFVFICSKCYKKPDSDYKVQSFYQKWTAKREEKKYENGCVCADKA